MLFSWRCNSIDEYYREEVFENDTFTVTVSKKPEPTTTKTTTTSTTDYTQNNEDNNVG